MVAEWRGRDAPGIGESLSLNVDASNIHLFDETGTRI